jgi:hypothetical protein
LPGASRPLLDARASDQVETDAKAAPLAPPISAAVLAAGVLEVVPFEDLTWGDVFFGASLFLVTIIGSLLAAGSCS